MVSFGHWLLFKTRGVVVHSPSDFAQMLPKKPKGLNGSIIAPALDAARAFCLHLDGDWRRASDAARGLSGEPMSRLARVPMNELPV